ncbi:hypothetical protein WH47_12214 [Habropoda laboriosa]|uniref:Uncharacterized protein n=1 Tax=Habropoda laboriosa TaxID=597456 RepID=A0A0L7RAK9_9HYME|nr:hypothetical protein WH47_12214 [Habropoda laboriosa]
MQSSDFIRNRKLNLNFAPNFQIKEKFKLFVPVAVFKQKENRETYRNTLTKTINDPV